MKIKKSRISWKDSLLQVLDPGRDKRSVAKLKASGLSFDVDRVFSSEEGKAELKRIGKMQERARKAVA